MMKYLKTVELEIKKSRFVGYSYKSTKPDDVSIVLQELKQLHKKATHVCYAYRFVSPFAEKAVDDGEPGGTAGRPILNVLQKKDLQDVLVVVVRYFGGVKLGAGGLVRAYSKTCAALF